MFSNKNILITGGTGSLGTYLTKYLLKNYKPNKIVIFSRDEQKQDKMQKALNRDDVLRFFLGDITEKSRLKQAFTGIDYVIHAAAMKIITSCDYNPFEAIKTNIIGAKNIIEACIEDNVKKCVFVSTDKSVLPVTLYGGTKFVAEKLFIHGNYYSGVFKEPIFSCVRYGNVAGSNGSIIPVFVNFIKNKIKNLPITDWRMTRFIMTLQKAVELIMFAFENSKAGEIYVAKNKTHTLKQLVDCIVKIYGVDVTYKNIGIRANEKLHEVMISDVESNNTYEYDNHYIVYPNFYPDKLKLDNGIKVDEGFVYSSNMLEDRLSNDELEKIIISVLNEQRLL